MRSRLVRPVLRGVGISAVLASTVLATSAGSGASTAGTAGGARGARAAGPAKGFVPSPPAQVVSSAPGATGSGFTATIYHWVVDTGPGRATACNIVGELFVPNSATSASPEPAILTTNGFGGSYTDQVALAELAVQYGYVVLTYSGLGFGGSGCDIELDSRAWDGEAASQLVSYLGDLPEVLKDGPDDPRVGMIGGSYGGEVQFATAAIDPRVDTIVPMITWNDLAYSLAPNNVSPDFRWNKAAPGVLKWEWTSLFFGEGLSEPFQNPTATPFPPSSCPGFDPAVCTAFLESASAGYPTSDVVSLLWSDSVGSYIHSIRVPVLLMQGEDDSLFNIDEAVANYDALRAAGDTVHLVLQSWGHSDLTPAPGELSYTSAADGYETVLILDWFAKYLKGEDVSTGPAIEYFRPWITYTGSAEPAYGTAGSWPVGRAESLYLSGGGAGQAGTLATRAGGVTSGSQSFLNPAAGEPASYSETSGVQDESPFSSIPPTDPPGTFASFETGPLSAALDSVGIPVLHLAITAADGSSVDPATEPELFAKIYDVSPSGSVTLVDRLVAPARIPGTGEITLTLPDVVHEYPAGDRIELVVAASDQAYLGSRVADALTIAVSPAAASSNVLSLPTVAASAERSGGPMPSGA